MNEFIILLVRINTKDGTFKIQNVDSSTNKVQLAEDQCWYSMNDLEVIVNTGITQYYLFISPISSNSYNFLM